jgi:hypothetical protein
MLTAVEALETTKNKIEQLKKEECPDWTFTPKSLDFILAKILEASTNGMSYINIYYQEIKGEVADKLQELGYEIVHTGTCNLKLTSIVRWDPKAYPLF